MWSWIFISEMSLGTATAKETNVKISKRNYIKLKCFCTENKNHKRKITKKKTTQWAEVVWNIYQVKNYYPKYVKKKKAHYINSRSNKNNRQNNLKRYFSKEPATQLPEGILKTVQLLMQSKPQWEYLWWLPTHGWTIILLGPKIEPYGPGTKNL